METSEQSPSHIQTVSGLLAREMEKRKLKNASYSLRAFARDLGLSASHLSEILRGTEGLSEKKASDVAQKLKLKASDTRVLLDLILAERSRSPMVRENAQTRLQKQMRLTRTRRLREDEFHFIADWYHAAIVEALALENCDGTPDSISEIVGVSPAACAEALARLARLNLVSCSENGKWRAIEGASFVQSDVPSSAIRKAHRQLLDKAIDAAISGKTSERSLGATVLAVPEGAVEELNQKINQFLAEVCEKYKDSPKQKLYVLAAQFFPVQKRRKT